MVQLYKAINKNYVQNGDYVLDNIISVLKFDGGTADIWDVGIEVEYDKEGIWRNIEEWDVIKLDTPMLKYQKYRIYRLIPNDNNLTFYARPLFYDLIKKVILDSRNVNANGQEAISKALLGTEYTGTSNIITRSNCNWVKKNIVNALIGNEDYSFLSNYKGELWIDNYNIALNNAIGGDYGVQCSYGTNVRSIEKDVNIDKVYTRIIPYADNNLMLLETHVDSPLINNYPIVNELPISMDDIKIGTEEGQFATETLAREEMKKRCLLMFSEDKIDIPSCNFKVGIESLQGSSQYNNFSDLVNIGLGDVVRVYYKPLGIDLITRCLSIKCEYNFALKEWEYIEVELGDAKEEFADKFNNTSNIAKNANNKINSITDGDSIIAEKVKGFLDATQTSLKASKQIGELQDYRIALSEDLDPASPTFGAMLWGSGKIFLADKRTLDGKDWDYSTAITPRGVQAEILIGKLLASIDGANYFDLETGIIKGKDLKIDLTNGSLNFRNGLIEGKDLKIDLENGIIDFRHGLIQGKDLSIDLENGIVKFTKGLIEGANSSWNLDSGEFISTQENGDKIVISQTDGFYRQIGSNKNEYFSLAKTFEISDIITPTKVGISTYTFNQIYEFDLPTEFIGKVTTVNTNLENSYASVLVIKAYENTYGWIDGNKLKVKYDLRDTTIGSKTIDGISCLTETPFAHTIDIKININIVA